MTPILQRTGWNLYKDDLRTILPRFGALTNIVKYMVEGPSTIRLPRSKAPEGEWLEPFLKMRQNRAANGPLEARSLYTVPNMFDATTVPPLTRQLVWEREADRDRCRKRVVRQPRTRIGHYQFAHGDSPPLDELIKRMDTLVSELALAVSRRDDQQADAGETEPLEVPPPERASSYLRWVRCDVYYGLQFGWVEAWVPAAMNEAWEALWGFLGAPLVDGQALTHCRERSDVHPRDYAELLTRRLK